jgi:hypothetical protein
MSGQLTLLFVLLLLLRRGIQTDHFGERRAELQQNMHSWLRPCM